MFSKVANPQAVLKFENQEQIVSSLTEWQKSKYSDLDLSAVFEQLGTQLQNACKDVVTVPNIVTWCTSGIKDLDASRLAALKTDLEAQLKVIGRMKPVEKPSS